MISSTTYDFNLQLPEYLPIVQGRSPRQVSSWNIYMYFADARSSCRGSGMTHHSIMTYQERLATYIETLAQQNADMARGVGQEQLSANMTSLFATPFSPHSSPEKTAQQAALDSLGKAAGAAAQVIPNMMTVLSPNYASL